MDTIEATERFILFSSIAMGIVQMMAQMPEIAEKTQVARYLRTKSKNHVSEAAILEYICKHFFRPLLLNSKSGPTRTITRV